MAALVASPAVRSPLDADGGGLLPPRPSVHAEDVGLEADGEPRLGEQRGRRIIVPAGSSLLPGRALDDRRIPLAATP